MIPERRLPDILAGGTLAVIGGAFLAASMQLAPNPFSPLDAHVVPMAASALLILVGVAIIAASFLPGRAQAGAEEPTRDAQESVNLAGLGAILVIALMTAAYIWLIQAVGYLLATLAVSPVLFVFFGTVNWRQVAVAALATTLILYLIFVLGLRIHLPSGWAFQY